MDQPLRDQIRYLELRLGECESQPELNREQIAAYREHLAIARQSRDALGYQATVEERGYELAIARAEWMDRYRAMGCVYRALGDFAKLQAARINYEAGLSATAAVDFAGHITDAKRRAAPIRIAAETSESAVPGLIAALLDWATEFDDDFKRDRQITVRSLWAMMRASDPRCTWQRMMQHPPYRHRIPLSDERLVLIGQWLRQTLGDALCDEPESPTVRTAPVAMQPAATQPAAMQTETMEAGSNASAAPPGAAASNREPGDLPARRIPTAAQIAAAYHQVHDTLDATDQSLATTRAVYERIFDIESRATSGPCFSRMMAEADLYCEMARVPWIARATGAIAHARPLAQAHVVAHHQRFIDLLQRASSQTGIEYEIEKQSQYLAVEHAWHDIVLRCATRPINAALFYELHSNDTYRRSVIASTEIACALFGTSLSAIIQSPGIMEFLAAMLEVYSGQSDPDSGRGVAAGEAGMAMGPLLRAILRDRAERGYPALATPGELCEHVLEIVDTLIPGSPSGAQATSEPALCMWGEPVRLEELHTIARAPPRPIVDLLAPII